ncbi:lambda-crystallin-like [Pomacea canaliculata]|uniref:lambda-crystallin-like n=1 Tax=Pomacea canaliculata TaxID=400727 RepID=UPI000D729E20|nr:lambda-crystallin-like [Pomacea canaliculata]
MADKAKKIAIIGSGNIGRSWALLFSCAEHLVCLCDNDPEQLAGVVDDLRGQLSLLKSRGLSRGHLEPEQQLKLITLSPDLAQCVQGADLIMECVPEVLEVKRQVLKAVDDVMSRDAIFSSSTSSLLPSELSEDLRHRDRFLVIHPTNPPFLARAVELVPAPWTSGDVMKRSRELMKQVGQAPITLKKEIPGFVLNRIQYAVLGESWRLLRDGVLDVEGINNAVWSGLGPRYAFLGPFEVGHLNAAGIENYLQRYGDFIYRMQASMGEAGLMGGQLAEDVQKVLEADTPLDHIPCRRRWKDVRLAALAKLKQDLDTEERERNEEGKSVPLPSDH